MAVHVQLIVDCRNIGVSAHQTLMNTIDHLHVEIFTTSSLKAFFLFFLLPVIYLIKTMVITQNLILFLR